MSGVVILGAGHAGSQLAVSLRAEGYAGPIALVDAEDALPYHKPPLSKTFLKSPEARPQPLRAASAYEAAGVTRWRARAVALDAGARRLMLADGRGLDYDDLVLATGARNRTLPGPAGPNMFTLRTLADAEALRAALPGAGRVTVIGGGFIGLETAAALVGMGHRVTVLEAAPRVLARVAAPETSALVAASLRAAGVDLRTGWAGGPVAAEVTLVGIGAEAEMGLALAAGLACDRGVLTDEALATSAPHVWAIGDVAQTPHWQAGAPERIESVQNATDQARTLARTLATGARQAFRAVPWFWSDIGALKLQIAGLAAGADAAVVREGGGKLAVFRLRDGRLAAVETVNSPADHMLARRLLEQGITPTHAEMLAGPEALKARLG